MAVRVSQDNIEAVIEAEPQVRVSQLPLETVIDGKPGARVTQDLLQAVMAAYPGVHISQIVIELPGIYLEDPMPLVYPTLPGLTFPVAWATDFANIDTQKASDGSEFDIGLAAAPLHTFTLSYEFLNDRFGVNEQRLLRGFFGANRGNLGRFLFWLAEDHRVRSQTIATTDGAAHVFDLKRTYGVGDASWTEPVGYVDQTQPFSVYLDGVKRDASSYTVDTTVPGQQQIIFTSIPTTGQVITVDMDYFYYCKFADPEMSLDKFMDALWSAGGIKLRSCRAGA